MNSRPRVPPELGCPMTMTICTSQRPKVRQCGMARPKEAGKSMLRRGSVGSQGSGRGLGVWLSMLEITRGAPPTSCIPAHTPKTMAPRGARACRSAFSPSPKWARLALKRVPSAYLPSRSWMLSVRARGRHSGQEATRLPQPSQPPVPGASSAAPAPGDASPSPPTLWQGGRLETRAYRASPSPIRPRPGPSAL